MILKRKGITRSEGGLHITMDGKRPKSRLSLGVKESARSAAQKGSTIILGSGNRGARFYSKSK